MTMEERITEIVDYCRNNNCEVSKSCGQCRTNATKQIAALIAADRAELVEALKAAQPLLEERLALCTSQSEYNKVNRVIKQIDSAIKEHCARITGKTSNAGNARRYLRWSTAR